MNFVDLILVLIILFSLWIGWEKGFINSCLDLLIWAGSLLAGFLLYARVAFLLAKWITPFTWILPVSFILVVTIVGIGLSLLTRLASQQIRPSAFYNKANRWMGLIPGCMNGCITAAVVTLLLLSVPMGDTLFNAARKSKIAARFAPAGEWLQEHISPVFYEVGKQNMARLSVETGAEKMVKLPFTKNNATIRTDLEVRMLELVNEERAQKGIKPLAADTAMTRLARQYAMDMLARGFFSHYTPEKQDPFDRMRQANISFLTAGENLALARTLVMAHRGLMNSPGHRANILNPAYRRLGIGILDAGIYGLMIVQEFRN